jgi:hypothetical protein
VCLCSWVVVSDAKGKVARVDIRAGGVLGTLKGAVGSVRAVSLHPTLDLLATVGLDRFLRVYDLKKRVLSHKLFLKQRLTACLFTADPVVIPEVSAEDSTGNVQTAAGAGASGGGAGDDDGMWTKLAETGEAEAMRRIQAGKKRRLSSVKKVVGKKKGKR